MIFDCCGYLGGIDPDPRTIAELWHMYLAKARVEWGQTAALCAAIANTARDPKRKRVPFKPSDFNPLADPKERHSSGGIPINRQTIGAVAKAWTGKSFDDEPDATPMRLPKLARPPRG